MSVQNQTSPHFMFIGVPRAGSTWLHKNLLRHPRIWTPLIKNILVFQRPLNFQINRLRTLRHFLLGRYVPKNKDDKKWLLRYFLTPTPSIKWYASLFTPKTGQIAGDITDDYLVLTDAEVKKIHDNFPHLKIIVMLRDPVERAWSHASHYFVNNKEISFSDVPTEKLAQRSLAPWLVERSRYLGLINIWQKYFPPEQIFIGFFEEINESPQAVLQRLCAFLGIEYNDSIFGALAEEKINRAAEADMPHYVRKALSEKLLPDLKILSGVFPQYAGEWLRKAEQALKQ